MRTKAELDAMSHQELKDYEQSLLALCGHQEWLLKVTLKG